MRRLAEDRRLPLGLGLAGDDDQEVRTERGELARDVPARALAEAREHHDRRNADRHADHREDRPQAVSPEGTPGEAEEVEGAHRLRSTITPGRCISSITFRAIQTSIVPMAATLSGEVPFGLWLGPRSAPSHIGVGHASGEPGTVDLSQVLNDECPVSVPVVGLNSHLQHYLRAPSPPPRPFRPSGAGAGARGRRSRDRG